MDGISRNEFSADVSKLLYTLIHYLFRIASVYRYRLELLPPLIGKGFVISSRHGMGQG